MKKYIIFFDIDGTIIHVPSGHSEPSNSLKNAIQSLQQQGHLCFIATGRTYAYLNPKILDLNFSGYITCNGAIIIKDNDVIASHCFNSDLKNEIVECMNQYNNSYAICGPKKAYTKSSFLDVLNNFIKFEVPQSNVCTDFDLNSIDCAKFEITAYHPEITTYIRSLKDRGLEVVEFGKGEYFEFSMPNITKGKAILELCQLLNIPIENTIAFGDGDNDIEMFQTVGYSVCMGNGTDAAKKVAHSITETCAEDGIVKELKRLKLIA